MSKQFFRRLTVATLVMISSALSLRGALAFEPNTVRNSIGMSLVEIPPGEFMMGSEEAETDTLSKFPYCDRSWLEGELPRHKVRITKPFYMGQYEVTLNEFLKFYKDANYKIEAERDGKTSWGYENGRLIESDQFRPWFPIAWKAQMDDPVVYVTWNDAVAFCEWLSSKEGKTYRLPTEAEWEYACRAGTNQRYSFGDEPEELVRFANAADQDLKHEYEMHGGRAVIVKFDNGRKTDTTIPFPFLFRRDGFAWAAPVGRFRPNAFGLYDMHGNAWEWCSDWYDANYYINSPTDDPKGPTIGQSHVARGGGFYDTPVSLRCASRYDGSPSHRYFSIGFRVVCDLK